MSNPNHAIIKTLCYADVFDYPLTKEEVQTFLIHHHPTTQPDINTSLQSLISHNIIHQQSDYYYLPKRSLLVSYRNKRHAISKQKLSKAFFISKYLAKIPMIEGVFVTGALAMENAHQHDDIDLMIITKTNWLWTTRIIVTFLLQLLGVRRKPKVESVNDLVCANMHLDESTLAIPETKRNLYTAHEIIQVKPLFNNHHIYQRFLNANSWISQFLPNFTIPSLNPTRTKPDTKQLFSNPIESLAYSLQHRYMKSKITSETISHHSAYFHPRDTSTQVLEQYEALVEHHTL